MSANSKVESSNQISTLQVSGFILSYRTSPFDSNGEVIGKSIISEQFDFRSLGAGLYSLNFDQEISPDRASAYETQLADDPRILSVSVNHTLTPAARFITPLSALRPATEPTDLKVANAIDFQQPTLPRLRLRWSPPAKLYGAEIIGYRIQYSTGTSKFRNLVSNTASNATKYYLTDGIVAGRNYRFRVRAITSDGISVAISPASASKSRLVRTTPKPVAITAANRIGPGSVRF
ncbi:MAG: fibronectin type III domain-containing protein, partial [Actinomycetota bacterium]